MRIVDTARLYNTVTVLTLSVAVVVYYVCLLGLFILAVSIIVPSSLLEARLGHPIGLSNYIVLAWLATSVATIAGGRLARASKTRIPYATPPTGTGRGSVFKR
ncbi:hypothetical protein [Salinisphaera sp. T31B1]|uniref:hypothetical protein n=1 Tax=Salinisphaera sp. T31B1 TaxID=727963 RepID=UPI003341F800